MKRFITLWFFVIDLDTPETFSFENARRALIEIAS